MSSETKSSAAAHPSREHERLARLEECYRHELLSADERAELHPEMHDNRVYFDGDKVCRPCARRNGVSYSLLTTLSRRGFFRAPGLFEPL
jgi:hypothetical protein